MIVHNYTIYAGNPYHRALYWSLEGSYEAKKGDIDAAIQALKAKTSNLFHVNWEEHCVRRCGSQREAGATSDYFRKRLAYFVKLGGKVVWTAHNALPHELEHLEEFLALRRELAVQADRIIVHSLEAAHIVTEQTNAAPDKIYYLPHPSYLGIYSTVGVAAAASRDVLLFGMVRRYKGIEWFLQAFAEAANLDWSGTQVRVVGETVPGDGYGHALQEQFGSNPAISLEYARTPDEKVMNLLTSAGCLVLPYERFLTSGVALLGLTAGLPVVAPDVPQLRDVLPPLGHRFLFKSGDAADVIRAVRDAINLDAESREQVRLAFLDRAEYVSPARISRQLGALYDSILAS